VSSTQAPSQAFIGGQWQKADGTFAVANPASGETLAEVADCGEREAQAAADAAVNAWSDWANATAYERAARLRAWHDLIIEHKEGIAQTISQEMGKPITEARGEANFSSMLAEWYAEEAKRVYGESIPSQAPHKRLHVIKQAVGPSFGITPWNFPAAMVTRKVAPALASGSPFILKPAEQAPLTSLYFAWLWEKAEGPAGTFQVLPALNPKPVSESLINDDRIRKLTFTGSTEVGKALYAQSAQTLKRVSLELGGHAPFLIFEDADIDKAVEQTMVAKFRNIGQSCVAANRLYVAPSIETDFAEAYAEAAKKLNVGDPLRDDTQIGPLVDEQGLEKVKRHVQESVDKGAKVLTGGSVRDGLFYEPTVLTGVQDGMPLMEEETFGPVAPIQPYESEDEAIRQANQSPYGLAAYIWTRDLERAYRVAEALDYGIIGVNDGVPSTPQAPFGGVKQSGLGREGGKWGIEEYLETKFISVGLD